MLSQDITVKAAKPAALRRAKASTTTPGAVFGCFGFCRSAAIIGLSNISSPVAGEWQYPFSVMVRETIATCGSHIAASTLSRPSTCACNAFFTTPTTLAVQASADISATVYRLSCCFRSKICCSPPIRFTSQ